MLLKLSVCGFFQKFTELEIPKQKKGGNDMYGQKTAPGLCVSTLVFMVKQRLQLPRLVLQTPATVSSFNWNPEFTVEQVTGGEIKMVASFSLLSLGGAQAPATGAGVLLCMLSSSAVAGGVSHQLKLVSFPRILWIWYFKTSQTPWCRGYYQTSN